MAAADVDTSKQTAKGRVEWDCSEDEPENREFLASILPDEFNYRVNKLKLEEKSEVDKETKFKLNLL